MKPGDGWHHEWYGTGWHPFSCNPRRGRGRPLERERLPMKLLTLGLWVQNIILLAGICLLAKIATAILEVNPFK